MASIGSYYVYLCLISGINNIPYNNELIDWFQSVGQLCLLSKAILCICVFTKKRPATARRDMWYQYETCFCWCQK